MIHAQGLVAGAADRGRSAVQCVLCLGHNKGMEEAASDLAVRWLMRLAEHALHVCMPFVSPAL